MSSNYPVIAGVQTIEPPPKIEDMMTKARVRILSSHPFLAFPVANTITHFSNNPEVNGTAFATTVRGRNDIVYDITAFSDMFDTPEKRAFLICHETMHLILEHLDRARKANYNPMIWSYATDYYINSRLQALAENNKNLECPDFGLFGEEWLEYGSADEIYYRLLNDAENDLNEALKQLGEDPNCSNGNLDSGSGEEDVNGDDGNGGGSGQGGCPKNRNPSNTGKKRPFDIIYGEEQSENHKTENKHIVASAVSQSKTKNIGTAAGNFLFELEQTLESKVPWQTILNDFVEKSRNTRRTYNHPNRKSGRVIFPSRTGEALRLVFGFDSSGSMTQEDYDEVASELMGILDQYDEFEVNIISCDTDTHDLGVWSSEEGDDISDVKVTAEGGGGTDLHSMVDHANKDHEDMKAINCCVILTDGYIPEETMEDSCENSDVPVIVLVTSEGNPDLNLENAMVAHMKNY